MYNGDLAWSRKEKVTDWAKFHRYLGYIMLFIGNLVCANGTHIYVNHFVTGPERSKALFVGPLMLIVFCLAVGICEFIYRKKARQSKMVLINPSLVARQAGKPNDVKIWSA